MTFVYHQDYLESCRAPTLLAELEDDDDMPEPDEDENDDDDNEDDDYEEVLVCMPPNPSHSNSFA